MKVAVVGTGIAGSSVVKHLTDAKLDDLETIHVFEKLDQVGKGLPYQVDSDLLLMNSYVGDLGFDQDPDHYLKWLSRHYPKYASSHCFSPRPIFGEYLADYFSDYYHDVKVQIFHEEVQAISQEANCYHLKAEQSGHQGPYQAVFLAIGHPPYADHYHLIGSKNYIHHPYPLDQKLKSITPRDKVAIIGSGLTGIDIMRYLQLSLGAKKSQPISFFIPKDPFSTAKYEKLDDTLQIGLNNHWLKEQGKELTLDQIISQFHQDMLLNGIDFQRLKKDYGAGTFEQVMLAIEREDHQLSLLQLYFRELTPLFPDLFNALSQSDQARFFNEYRSIFEHFRSQMPEESLELLNKWHQYGQIRLIHHAQSIKVVENGFELYSKQGLVDKVDIVINAGGFEMNLSKAIKQDPFLKQAFESGLIQAHPLGGIKVTWPQGQVIDQKGKIHDDLYLMGSWISSTQLGNNNTHLTYEQGERAVQNFISRSSAYN
ncbi:FAD/NAD(P)-binding protein [Facklamia hominis]|uniref:FAD/NAD(P)-binding protein n=1 Tax=Facklamia hominis TaxID=178214 RepID=UPI00101B6271|nr:FAD/NAD(P)-binding protein [Facklamia hominis]RYC97987.1 hypothetical protein EKN08_05020 [Facklamia hominis]